MDSSDAALARLQQLIDASFERASPHLRSIMTPDRRLTAAQIGADVPCPAVLNIATVTSHGEPRISAVDGHFLGATWYFTTAAGSPKARHLSARPAVSASYTPRDGYGVFCHGQVVVLTGDEQAELAEHLRIDYGVGPESFGEDIFYARIEPTWFVGFAFPERDADPT